MTKTTDQDEKDIKRVEKNGVLTLTLTRDRKLNAVTPGMLDAFRLAIHDMNARDDLRVLVITAEGRYFTAGIDISTLDREPGKTSNGEHSGLKLRTGLRKLHNLIDSLEQLEKPVVIAIQGPCLGLGLEIAVSCDFRLAAQRASFSLPEIPNMGVLAGSGGISRLTRLIGPHWARWIALASKSVSAEQALQIGLVHEIYSDGDFPEKVQEFAAELAALPGEALALAKLAIDAAASSDRTTARDFDRIANTLLIMSEKNLQTVTSFHDKASGHDKEASKKDPST